MSIVLVIETSIIIPQFINLSYKVVFKTKVLSHTFVTKYRSAIIVIFRTLSSIIIPIILAVFLLNDCGNGWSLFWNGCNNANKHTLAIDFEINEVISVDVPPVIFLYINNNVELLKSNVVCTSNDNFVSSKCIRSFFSSWTQILIEKIGLMIFMPYFIIAQ
eukprot:495142_1